MIPDGETTHAPGDTLRAPLHRVIAARLPELLLTWQAHAQIIAAVMDHVQLAEPAPKPGRKVGRSLGRSSSQRQPSATHTAHGQH